MSAQHTPGPWTVTHTEYDETRVSDESEHIATIWRTAPAYESNARLIAASPDLLNMLQRMLDETSGGGVPCLLTLEHARNAITKAQGKES